MEISKALNLVVPVSRDAGSLYVHIPPLPFEVFRRYYRVLSRTFAEIHQSGLGVAAGPRVAALELERVSREMGIWDDPSPIPGRESAEVEPGVNNGLMAHIRRVSSVLALTEAGWAPLPLQIMIDRKAFTPEEVSRIESQAVFFTVACAMHPPEDLAAILNGVCVLWNAAVTSSNSTEHAASLKTSTGNETSTGTAL